MAFTFFFFFLNASWNRHGHIMETLSFGTLIETIEDEN